MNKNQQIWSEALNAAATYFVPPITAVRYGKILLGIEKKDPDAGFMPEKRDPDYVEFIYNKLRPFLTHYFRTEISGTENLPEKGAGLIVGNHNGGLQPFDVFIAAGAIIDTFGAKRPFYGLGHDYLFREPAIGKFMQKCGLIKANHKSAEKAFKLGGLSIVYPGGDIDTFKPFSNRHSIEFGGRKGFIKLALRNSVPIYPVVSIGCHEQWIVLSRGEKIAKLLGLKKRLRTEVFPIVFSLPWGITSGFLPYIPFPSKITVKFLEPISWPHLSPKEAEDPVILEKCYNDVTLAMQKTLNKMAKSRKYPVFG